MRVTYANCHPAAADVGDVLVTGERVVAAAAPSHAEVVIADEHYAVDSAQRLNERMWKLAFEWSRCAHDDPTMIDGISAADVAGVETALTVLLPAARAVLELDALLRDHEPARFHTVVPASRDAMYVRVESVTCDAAEATVRARLGDGVVLRRHTSRDARNAIFETKYSRMRNPVFLTDQPRMLRASVRAAAAASNAAAAARTRHRGGGLLVLQYNPTTAFVKRYVAAAGRRSDLVCMGFDRDDVRHMLRAGHRAFVLPPARPGSQAAALRVRLRAFTERHDEQLRELFTVEEVDLLPVVLPRLEAIAGAYGRWLEGRAAAVRRGLRRRRLRAVLVPFETPPEARLIVRAAQAEGIPAILLNDGWKGDDHTPDGMTVDHALALSTSIAEHYFRRRADRTSVVTGDPRSDGLQPPATARRRHGVGLEHVLVGSFTFSPSDLNCRRSDGERFMAEVLAAIAASRARDARITVKLHPADQLELYAEIVARFGDLRLELTRDGDVVERLADADVYITTYSTSLLQAAMLEVPFLYYRVNEQRLHPPFSDDETMARRTAATPDQLTALLDAPPAPTDGLAAWSERFIGPRDGRCTARVVRAVDAASRPARR